MSWISGPGISIAPGTADAAVSERVSYSIAAQQENAILNSRLQPGGDLYNDYSPEMRDLQISANNESTARLTQTQRSIFSQYPNVAAQFPALSSQLGFGTAAAAGVLAVAAGLSASAHPVDAPKQTEQQPPTHPSDPFIPDVQPDIPVSTSVPHRPLALGMPLNYFAKKKFRLILENSAF